MTTEERHKRKETFYFWVVAPSHGERRTFDCLENVFNQSEKFSPSATSGFNAGDLCATTAIRLN